MHSLDLSGKQIDVEVLVNEAIAALADGKLSFGEIVHLGGVLAGKANQIAQLSGPEKKALVVGVVDLALQEILKKAGVDSAKVESVGQFAKEALPAVLDVVVDAARGRLDLRKPALRAACWSGLVSLLGCTGAPAALAPLAPQNTVEEPQQVPQVTVPSEPLAPTPEGDVTQGEQPAETQETQPNKDSESNPVEVA
jgi:hypothetical protein